MSLEYLIGRKYFPKAVSLISVGMNYYTGYAQSDLNSNFKFSNYAWGDDYHEVLKTRLKILLEWISIKFNSIPHISCKICPILEIL